MNQVWSFQIFPSQRCAFFEVIRESSIRTILSVNLNTYLYRKDFQLYIIVTADLSYRIVQKRDALKINGPSLFGPIGLNIIGIILLLIASFNSNARTTV